MNKRILFISGSLGLGHVTRDIAIANESCSHPTDIVIHWSAEYPASLLLERRGKALLSKASGYHDEDQIAESAAQSFKLSQFRYPVAIQRRWQYNIDLGVP
jgi:hypothetical protein